MATPNVKNLPVSNLRWNKAAQRYIGPKGRFISPRQIRAIVDADIENRGLRMVATARRLQTQGIDWLATFEVQFKAEIKALHLTNAAAAVGGFSRC